MADGIFYLDTRAPFITGDIGSVTLATTDKALYPVANFPVLGGQYWNFVGKKMWIHLFGRATTQGTPGNITWDIYYGNGTDANGTILASSAAVALVANATALSWSADIFITCRTIGGTGVGTLFVTGCIEWNVGLMLSTNQPQLIPASSPAASPTIDLTAANIISVQVKRSGSTGETMQVHELSVVAMN